MEIETILIGFAQIGVMLIGFSSVFLTFLLRDNTTDPVLRMHARALIMVSPFVLIMSILPLALHGFGLNEAAALRWSAAIILAPGTLAGVLNNMHFLRLSKPDRRRTGYGHMALANIILVADLIFIGLLLAGKAITGSYIGLLVSVTFGSVLALFTFFIDELDLFRSPREKDKE